MKYVLALRALDVELYEHLPKDFLILNFCFSSNDYYDEENVINIDMNDYGIMNPSYTLLRETALIQIIEENINKDDILLLYVKDLDRYDGFINITNKDYFLADFMYKRKHLNYYLCRVPTIFENSNDFDNYLKIIEEYGNIVSIRILRNFLVRNNEITSHMVDTHVAMTILDIVSGYTIKELKKQKEIK